MRNPYNVVGGFDPASQRSPTQTERRPQVALQSNHEPQYEIEKLELKGRMGMGNKIRIILFLLLLLLALTACDARTWRRVSFPFY